MESILASFDLPAYPLRFEFLPAWAVVLLFFAVAIPVVVLGRQSVRWQGAARGWTVIGVRLAAVWILVLLIGGARLEHRSRDVETIVLKDVSASTASVPHAIGTSVAELEDAYIKKAAERKRPRDRVGVISFDDRARVDALPSDKLRLSAKRATLESRDTGTDIASALQLALASFRGDCMRRITLISDGNVTSGDTAAAVEAAAGAGVAIDVVPLTYKIAGDVMIDRVIAPPRRREGDAVTLDVVLRSTNVKDVSGRIVVSDHGQAVDLDAGEAGVQTSIAVDVPAGVSHQSIRIPRLAAGMHTLVATFEANASADDVRTLNNAAEAITFVRGKPRVLYVENVEACEAELLADALRQSDLTIGDGDHLPVERFPQSVAELQGYDAVILANIARGGADGLNARQEHALVQYVRDLGGGLVVVGGPSALGAGQWHESELETILPVWAEPTQRHDCAPGALVIVIDHSGSMNDAFGGMTKQAAANSAAMRAVESVSLRDNVGVIAFNAAPTWVVPLGPNRNPAAVTNRIMGVSPAGGTSIGPALEEAYVALAKLPAETVGVRHILLMTDGVSEPANYPGLLARLADAKITMSTVAVGGDADFQLLATLARQGGGLAYNASDAKKLSDAFVRDAQTLRRPLIVEPPGGIVVAGETPLLNGMTPPALSGMALTAMKTKPLAEVILSSATRERDPVLARWCCGLGKVAVFTGDATPKWAEAWISSGAFEKFWPGVVRAIARGPANNEFELRTIRDGARTRIVAEALVPDASSGDFVSIVGKLSTPDPRKLAVDVHLAQTGVGTYAATVDTPDPGAYFASFQVQSAGQNRGELLAAIVVNASAELRDLQSNDALLAQIASYTGGRVLTAFDPSADLFSRENLRPATSSEPIDHLLLPLLMGIIVLDVAVRRVAWDWARTRALLALGVAHVHGMFATTQTGESVVTLATLRKVHRERAGNKFAASAASGAVPTVFVARPSAAASATPQATEGRRGYAVSLMAAKQRAREQIHQIERNAGNRG